MPKQLTRGATVWAKHGMRWWPGVVMRTNAKGGYRIHYNEGGPIKDEDVNADAIVDGEAKPPGPKGNPSREMYLAITAGACLLALVLGLAIADDMRTPTVRAQPPDGAVQPTPERLTRELPVWVERSGMWHPGFVLAPPTDGHDVLVHYQAHWAGEDQEVAIDHLRLR